eukprot:scaffold12534_cov63-Attheya_sp.AAC.1
MRLQPPNNRYSNACCNNIMRSHIQYGHLSWEKDYITTLSEQDNEGIAANVITDTLPRGESVPNVDSYDLGIGAAFMSMQQRLPMIRITICIPM